MKKYCLCLYALFAAGIFSVYGFAGNLLECSFSLGSGVPLYSEQTKQTRSIHMEGVTQQRVILCMDAGLSLLLGSNIRFKAGAVSVQDYVFSGSRYAHFIDYAIYGGFRIFPANSGFNFGVDYLLSQRTDFFGGGQQGAYRTHTPWGNGFRILAEYDFHNGRQGLAPALCINWRWVPRGSYGIDNYLMLAIKLSYL